MSNRVSRPRARRGRLPARHHFLSNIFERLLLVFQFNYIHIMRHSYSRASASFLSRPGGRKGKRYIYNAIDGRKSDEWDICALESARAERESAAASPRQCALARPRFHGETRSGPFSRADSGIFE